CKLFGLRFSGFAAWWLARSIHLLLLPGLERKLRVVIDWTLELFFPRDLNYLDLQRTEPIEHLHLNAGETLFRQGEQSHTFYVIQEGTMQLSRRDAIGQILQQTDLTTGDHFGEGSLLGDGVRATTAIAQSGCTLLAIGQRNFQSVFKTCAALRHALQETSRRFRPDHELVHANWPPELLAASVREVMSTPVQTLPATATIAEALDFLAERRRGVIPLVEADGHLVSILTRTDLYRVIAEDRDFSRPVLDIASDQLVTLTADLTVGEALSTLRRRRLKHAPVVDDQRHLLGMLSTIDIAMASLRLQPPSNSGSQRKEECRLMKVE
ncbi:MAG TPA: CBS domain-containing protein, partial [Planctomycetaceae bacterium]|nr:CBS domain-containing protein [Planctomycetaceae bacterium]